MKIAIILFSSSGNTVKAAELFKLALEKLEAKVEIYNVTKSYDIFEHADYAAYVKKYIKGHDVLCIGAPVFEHHLPKVIVDLIRALPTPNESWGKYAFPFVTYGYISSGMALEDAGKMLRDSGRVVLGGMKLSAPHSLLDTLLGRSLGAESSEEEIRKIVNTAAMRIVTAVNAGSSVDNSSGLKYQSFKKRLFDMTILNPRFRFINLLPKIMIDNKKCTACQVCIHKCPVNHLALGKDGRIVEKAGSPCIHCFQCMKFCPQEAIRPSKGIGLIEKFVGIITKNGFENIQNAVYPEE